MIVRAAYRPFPVNCRSIAYPGGRTAYRPSLTVVFSNGRKSIPTIAIVDTGADFSIFPGEIAAALGMDVRHGKSLGGVQLLGMNVCCSILPVTMVLNDRIRLRCEVAFTTGKHIGLLGQRGFLDRMDRFTLYPQEQSFELECSDGLMA